MSLAPLFRYPAARLAIDRGDADLDAFATEMSALDLAEQQSTYTTTFDLAASCTPYVGIHLFGDENPDRARLMIGLKLAYKRLGIESAAELPDHVAEVLAFADRKDAEEHEELVRFVLLPALTKMNAILSPTTNPYRHLVAAAIRQISPGGAS
ncbi:MAG TPA: molecular chaperone TorD family protein [Thermoanaerobaculia bacterium]